MLNAHPVNPPIAIPVVEIIKAPWVKDATAQAVRTLMSDVGMSPVVLNREVPGFIVNRLQYAVLTEAYRLVEDGIASPQDVDTAICDGLGLRWSFMGPFQTIDLNAPQGVKDYCERYSSGIVSVARTQDHSQEWKQETIDKIDSAMREQVPRDQLAQRLAWRDNRLMHLAVHKMHMKEQEQERNQSSEPDASSQS
jgi:3-hydroxyacyl-CoA dehydrogenase